MARTGFSVKGKTIAYEIEFIQSKDGKETFVQIKREANNLVNKFKDASKAAKFLEKDFERQTAKSGRTANALKKQIKILRGLRDETATTSTEFRKQTVAIDALEKEFNDLTESQIKNGQVTESMISNTGLAGATINEFGRFISDMPFGITAVTNNLSQLGTLFVTLISKTKSAKNALALLGRQLMGTTGLVVILQVVISLIQFYNEEIAAFFTGTSKAEEAQKKFKEELEESSRTLEEQRLKMDAYLKVLDDSNSSMESRNNALKELDSIIGDVINGEGNQKQSTEELKLAVKEYVEQQLIRAKLDATIAANMDIFEEEAAKRRAIEKIRNAETRKEKLALMRDEFGFFERMKMTANMSAEESLLYQEDLATFLENFSQSLFDSADLARQSILDLTSEIEGDRLGKAKEALEIKSEDILDPNKVDPIMKKVASIFGGVYKTPLAQLREFSKESEKDVTEGLNRLKRKGLEELRIANEKEEFLRQFTETTALDKLNRQEEQSLLELELLNGSEEERLKIEEYYATQRTIIAEKEELAKDRIRRDSFISLQKSFQQFSKAFKETEELAIAGIIVEKAAAIAKIVSNTQIANAKARAAFPLTAGQPYVTLNRIAAGLSIASTIKTGADAIQSIKSKSPMPTSSVGGASGGVAASVPPEFNIVGASEQSQLAQTIAQAEQQPVQAYVVAEDITTAQQLDRNVIQTASLG